jgi:hypothetical protein
MQAKGAFCAAAGCISGKRKSNSGGLAYREQSPHEIKGNFTVFVAILLDLLYFVEIRRDLLNFNEIR